MVAGTSEGLGARAMSVDFCEDKKPALRVDAPAALGIAQRKGLGTVRHLDTKPADTGSSKGTPGHLE